MENTKFGDTGYEVQVLDSYNNRTYSNGQAASVYKQHMPLVNASKKPEEQLEHGFRLVTSRLPNEKEKGVLHRLFKERLAFYKEEPRGAKALLSVGESKLQENLPEAEHAAWITVARALLNLSETITKN